MLPCSSVIMWLTAAVPPASQTPESPQAPQPPQPPQPPEMVETVETPLTITQTEDVLYGPTAGEFLVSFSANYRYAKASAPESSADETEIFTGRATFGMFLTREHEAGVEITPSYVTTELGGSNFDMYLGGYYSYNIWTSPQSNFYFGPQLGLFYTDPTGASSSTAFSWGAHGGLRYWIDPSVSLNIEPRLTFTYLDEELGGDETVFDLLFGISFKL